MRKIILILTMVATMAFSGICMAADGGTLNKQQNVVEPFIASFSDKAPAYAKVSAGFDSGLLAKMDEKSFNGIKKEVKTKFGDLKEVKFYSFERLGEQDRVTYLASFSNEQLVSIVCVFNKDNKMIEFGLLPLKVEQNNTASTENAAK